MTFLNKISEVEIYESTRGFCTRIKEDLVCKLKKVLYRLKQSLRMCYHRIDSFLINEGFCRSQTYHLLYIKQTNEYLLVAIVYVDDLIILASNVTQLKWLKSELEKEFEMSDLGELQHYLGVEFEKNTVARTIIMNQRSYIKEIFKRFNMEEYKPVGTPFNVNSKLLKLLDEKFVNVQRKMENVPNKAGVGSLMYAMVATRADLICSKYGEPNHVEGQSTALGSRKMYHKVFEGHFELQIMPQRKKYFLRKDFAMWIW